MTSLLSRWLFLLFALGLFATAFSETTRSDETSIPGDESPAPLDLQWEREETTGEALSPPEEDFYTLRRDDVLELRAGPDDQIALYYVWSQPARVNEMTIEPGRVVYPRHPIATLSISGRSKAKIRAAETFTILQANIRSGDCVQTGQLLFILRREQVTHDSVSMQAASTRLPSDLKTVWINLWQSTGLFEIIRLSRSDWKLGVGRIVMISVGLVLLYLAVKKGFEPLLLIPIGFGGILANIPLAMLSGPDGLLGLFHAAGIETGLFPLLIFLGIGAMTDFGPLLANPMTALLAAAAQLGIFGALLGALLLNDLVGLPFTLREAASIGIIGGADGPTAIFLTSRLAPNLLGAIAVSAYSYMALVPIIQPPIMRWLTTRKERGVRMEQLRPVSKLEKLLFPILVLLLCALLLPDAAPLIGMLMFGNFLRECGVVERLNNTAQNALINIVTIFLGLSVGSKLSADQFLNAQTLGILMLGLVAFSVSTAGGVLLGKVMCRLSGGKVNPLIGAAGVSAVPMSARVVNKVGQETDPQNFLLMHAMGPNVAGVIGSAVAAGVLLNALKGL
jgi:oxaloacetate decarboxylase beta subunit